MLAEKGMAALVGIPKRHARRVAELADLNDGSAWCVARDRVLAGLTNGFVMVLCGPRGTGKTQLAAIACAAVNAKKRPARFATAATIFGEIRAAMSASGKSDADVINDYAGGREGRETSGGLLVIDEMHERGESDFEDRTLATIVNRRYAAELDTLLLTNETPKQAVASLGPSIVDRIRECGGFIELNGPSFRAGGVA